MTNPKAGRPNLIRNNIFVLTAIGIVALCTAMVVYDETHPFECTSQSTVEDILSLEGRSATIKLSNGQIVSVNQAYLKKGDNHCLKYERKKQK